MGDENKGNIESTIDAINNSQVSKGVNSAIDDMATDMRSIYETGVELANSPEARQQFLENLPERIKQLPSDTWEGLKGEGKAAYQAYEDGKLTEFAANRGTKIAVSAATGRMLFKVVGKCLPKKKYRATAPKSIINENLVLDEQHVAKHLPDTPQSARLIRKDGAAHVFTDEATMQRVTTEVFDRGEYTGFARGAERYGLEFPEPIGYRIAEDGSRVPLHYGEVKVVGEKFHTIPRTRPSKR